MNYSKMTDITEEEEGNVHVPKIPLTVEEIQRREIYRLACSKTNFKTPMKRPVSTYDVFQALQVKLFVSVVIEHNLTH